MVNNCEDTFLVWYVSCPVIEIHPSFLTPIPVLGSSSENLDDDQFPSLINLRPSYSVTNASPVGYGM